MNSPTHRLSFVLPILLIAIFGVTQNSFAQGTNVAEGKPATQSSTGFNGPAEKAVDGNTNGVHSKGSLSHTGEGEKPWWEVDLGKTHLIGAIRIHNRTDCCANRLDGAVVMVSTIRFPPTP